MSLINPNKIYQSIEDLRSALLIQNAEFLDLAEASAFLKLKNSYIYNLVYKKQIPHYKPNGKKLYFKKNELVEWISSSKIKSTEEVRIEYSLKNSL